MIKCNLTGSIGKRRIEVKMTVHTVRYKMEAMMGWPASCK